MGQSLCGFMGWAHDSIKVSYEAFAGMKLGPRLLLRWGWNGKDTREPDSERSLTRTHLLQWQGGWRSLKGQESEGSLITQGRQQTGSSSKGRAQDRECSTVLGLERPRRLYGGNTGG